MDINKCNYILKRSSGIEKVEIKFPQSVAMTEGVKKHLQLVDVPGHYHFKH